MPKIIYVNTVPMLKERPRWWREFSAKKTAHNRQCVETIQEEPKLKLYYSPVMSCLAIVLGRCSKHQYLVATFQYG